MKDVIAVAPTSELLPNLNFNFYFSEK